MIERCVLALAVSFFLVACEQEEESASATAPPVASTPSSVEQVLPAREVIDAAVDEYTRTFINQQSALATSLGLSEEEYGAYNQRLPDYSPKGMQTLREDMRAAAEKLAALADPSLSEEAQRHLQVNEVLARYYAGLEGFSAGYVDTWGGHLPYVLNQFVGPLIDLPNILQDQHDVLDAQDAESYVARLTAFSQVADQVRTKVQVDADAGVILPKPLFPNTLGYLSSFAEPDPADHPLITSFADKLAGVKSLEPQQREAYVDQAVQAVRDQIYPAIAAAADTLTRLEDQAPENVGIWAQPGGEQYYEHAITYLADSSLTADEIHQLGLDEVARIGKRMDEILRANGYTEGSVGERMQQLNEEPRFLYADSGEGRAELLEFLRGEIETIEERAPDFFSTLPPQDVEVRRIPVAAEAGSSGGYYIAPSLDGSRPGVFFINLKDMKAVPEFGMKTLTYHEAVPGHHFQLALNQLQTDIGIMRQNAPFNGFVEGWALYSELLAFEMGMYEDDPFGDLGRLQAEIYRAARLVVDTGLHHKKWTREKAIEYFAETTGTTMSDVVPAIDRYIAMPGQALGYKLGMVKLVELREKARQALGEHFDIKDFHDRILLPGARPMRMVEQEINNWIAESS
jgi:uncharacterized protein (DUF885 family)